jgi:hypothetical protein
MKVLFRLIAALLVAIGALLIYAVIHALGSDGGARAGVAVAYVVGALVLGFAATKLWGAGGKRSDAAQA